MSINSNGGESINNLNINNGRKKSRVYMFE